MLEKNSFFTINLFYYLVVYLFIIKRKRKQETIQACWGYLQQAETTLLSIPHYWHSPLKAGRDASLTVQVIHYPCSHKLPRNTLKLSQSQKHITQRSQKTVHNPSDMGTGFLHRSPPLPTVSHSWCGIGASPTETALQPSTTTRHLLTSSCLADMGIQKNK